MYMLVYGDVVYAQTWQVLTLKNCIEPFSYASTAYVVASALISVRLFWANGLPPPLAKNSPYAYGPGENNVFMFQMFWKTSMLVTQSEIFFSIFLINKATLKVPNSHISKACTSF